MLAASCSPDAGLPTIMDRRALLGVGDPFPIDNASTEFDKFSQAILNCRRDKKSGGAMGLKADFTAGHLRIDLSNIKMSPDDREDLLRSVRATCIDLTSDKISASDREDFLRALQADR